MTSVSKKAYALTEAGVMQGLGRGGVCWRGWLISGVLGLTAGADVSEVFSATVKHYHVCNCLKTLQKLFFTYLTNNQ